MRAPQTTIPTPDPTVLTTELMRHENKGLKTLLVQRIKQVEKAVALAHANLVRVPTETDRAVSHLQELVDQKFENVATQFKERDTRVEQTAKAGAEALSAALQAAKEAVGEQNKSSALSISKSEANTTKLIDGLNETLKTIVAANDKAQSDLKERIQRLEGMKLGAQEATTDKRAVSAATIATISLGIGFILSMAAVGGLLLRLSTGH